MKWTWVALLLLSIAFTVNCGNAGSGAAADPSQELLAQSTKDSCQNSTAPLCYSFTITINGVSCPTGKREYKSLLSYCAGLKNDALNNNCAKEDREKLFAQRCQ